ncbi:MAG: hypothetical protein RBU21_24400, partial [FCB group bacterium]|nr:hypothetical protein [FCB group bacterium]
MQMTRMIIKERRRMSHFSFVRMIWVVTTSCALGAGDAPPVRLELRLEEQTLQCYVPYMLEYTMENTGSAPLPVEMLQEGVPRGLGWRVTDRSGSEKNYPPSLEMQRVVADTVELAPGATLCGRLVIGVSEDGFVFSEPGEYKLRLLWRDSGQAVVATSEPLASTVVRPTPANERAAHEFALIALKWTDVEPGSLDLTDEKARIGMYRCAGNRLALFIGRQMPYRARPDGDAQNQHEWRMVEELRHYIGEFPDSPYAAYVARFLAFVDMD